MGYRVRKDSRTIAMRIGCLFIDVISNDGWFWGAYWTKKFKRLDIGKFTVTIERIDRL